MVSKIEQNIHAFAQEIELVAQLKAQGKNPETLANIDPEAATELSNLIGMLDEAEVMPAVTRRVEEIRRHTSEPQEKHISTQKNREPKKIPPPQWHSDPFPLFEIIYTKRDPNKPLQKALGSDARHDVSEQRKKLRKQLGLPEKSPPWKEMLQKFHNLTEEDKNILAEMGFYPDNIKNPYSLRAEVMLRALDRYKNS